MAPASCCRCCRTNRQQPPPAPVGPRLPSHTTAPMAAPPSHLQPPQPSKSYTCRHTRRERSIGGRPYHADATVTSAVDATTSHPTDGNNKGRCHREPWLEMRGEKTRAPPDPARLPPLAATGRRGRAPPPPLLLPRARGQCGSDTWGGRELSRAGAR
jgi:hypothetical protein